MGIQVYIMAASGKETTRTPLPDELPLIDL